LIRPRLAGFDVTGDIVYSGDAEVPVTLDGIVVGQPTVHKVTAYAPNMLSVITRYSMLASAIVWTTSMLILLALL
jgi:hypothetical protein